MYVRRIVAGLTLALAAFGASPASAVELFNYTDQSHVYCPRGASLYWGILGYWCEDSALAGVQPFDCKSGPGQSVGTWNNGSQTPDQLCRQQSSMPSQPTTTNP
jgi:hypothetical protein